ncbi:phycocyanin alpha phycocyanobilin lyase : Similar to tr/Q8YVS1/Q8YVS1 OS=Microcystis aeruginosa PCC 9807 GN=MICAF_960001 PE=4 SV=1: HEAT_2: HEAT_2 [Gemmata massiliana]|uniref:HEAT repeat domain-containing protein n=1 Tax=Gemmata massiliana TaxID=1210884 RepID=A0A6P2D0Y3_9BACT|nr:HEAT repeat domain-containing protein [Gemmata massiliana]VTR93110.1 phycocyanin alpha phycocyanobilin lyase : Similar to tr/Q8YVS1/Q8YVS1 OS=Microcystis aeruginosa PCC 9807 GN=MICAF_960001 PE=4 SV=1: HEAT_2: HEAT_2 [Gemmata massiliana]
MYHVLLCGVAVVTTAQHGKSNEPTQEQRIHQLLGTLKSGQEEDQKKAAHGLWDAIHYRGIGTLSAKEVVSDLAESMTHKSDYVREYVADALAAVRHEAAVPVLIKALDDPSPVVRRNACAGLADLGPKAKAAIPLFTAKIKDRTLLAFRPLAAIAGKDSVPVILESVESGKLSPENEYFAAAAIAEFADPRATEFMGRQLDRRGVSYVPVDPAKFFAKLGDEKSLARLRKCLDYLPTDDQGQFHPATTRGAVADVRTIAVEALGRKKDKASFDAVLKMIADDPSILVRKAAVTAMGDFADPKAIPALVKVLARKDAGFGADGHPDGDLHRAAVRALDKIGTDEALSALYTGAKDGEAKARCLEFWTSTKEPKHLDIFLKLYDAEPRGADFAAGVIDGLLRNQKERKLTAKEQTAAEEEFFKNVDDAARFGPKADLSDDGKWRIRVAHTFHPHGFATVEFGFRDVNPRGFGHGYSVLYRKVDKQWKVVGQTSGWKE